MLHVLRRLSAGLVLLPLCLSVPGEVAAQSRVDMRGVDPSQCDVYLAIGRALPPECQDAGPSAGVTTRGLDLEFDPGPSGGGAAPGGAPAAGGKPATGGKGVAVGEPPPAPHVPQTKEGVFTLQFALNSAVLTPQARAVLDKVAVVMNDPANAGARYVVKGFTDASGSDAANMALSQARADSARAYLVNVRGVTAASITAEGRGEAGLLPGLPANSPWHRRVEILADFRG
ncbi:OmpA family protein [Zavarzinia sp.]|uniref:OmpA family protein n=1 Tax=Zavarzinia sp. TaxID=2027920 RepID=UPI00356A92E1